MSKPEWLKEAEKKKNSVKFKPHTCGECEYWGTIVGSVKLKVDGKVERCVKRECDVHPGCINTRFAYACPEWSKQSV